MSDGFFFVGVLFFFFLIWFVGGGPTRPISFSGPYITPVTDVNQTQQGYGSTNNWFTGGGTGSGSTATAKTPTEVRSGLLNAEQELRRLQGVVTDLNAFGEPSPYKGMVKISGVSAGQTAKEEYLTLQVSGTQSVTITGWKLKSSATGKSATIPDGTELPKSGINTTGPLVLSPGDQVIIATGDSPIGVSFRENMCVGYFGQRQTFYPSLWSSCPSALTEFNRYYPGNKLKDDACYTYVSSLPTCTTVTDPPTTVNRTCESFVDEYLDYNGCVWAHRYEVEFKQNRYRVFLEHGSKLWKSSREAIKLLDQNGKTVDLYTY
ncbi:MAG: lamin tail domain-containing protein [Patescibacteria group bacterium]